MDEFIITVKETQNPAILKFECNRSLVKQGDYEFRNIDEAGNSPLARELFYLPFVKTVYVSGNFVAIERYNIVEWDDVKSEVAQQLVEYLNAGQPVVDEPENTRKEAVTVYAEVTPNPAVMKYVANKRLVPRVFEFKSAAEAGPSPLARKIFGFAFVREVFMDLNYISVTKTDGAQWDAVSMELREFIRNYLADGGTVIDPEYLTEPAAVAGIPEAEFETLDPVSKEIAGILEEYVKPAVASDGGNIVFQSYEPESKTVRVVLQGACSGCPSSTFTLKNGIETMLRNMMGDRVSEVVAING